MDLCGNLGWRIVAALSPLAVLHKCARRLRGAPCNGCMRSVHVLAPCNGCEAPAWHIVTAVSDLLQTYGSSTGSRCACVVSCQVTSHHVTPVVQRRVMFFRALLSPHVIHHVMSFLLMERAGQIAIPGRCVINAREDAAKQEETASDSSVKCKICLPIADVLVLTLTWQFGHDLPLLIYRHDLHLRLTYQAFGPSVV